ncbi:MAG: hypothetical protein IH616_05340, partial [Gemmatimonadales bacterium]|nr:hypothetical protein [Gemmatimonadales bacterium]
EYGNVLGQAPIRQAARWGIWKGVRADVDRPLELYDLATDPGETTDVAVDHPDVVRGIAAYLDSARIPARAYPAEVSTYRYVGQDSIRGW